MPEFVVDSGRWPSSRGFLRRNILLRLDTSTLIPDSTGAWARHLPILTHENIDLVIKPWMTRSYREKKGTPAETAGTRCLGRPI